MGATNEKFLATVVESGVFTPDEWDAARNRLPEFDPAADAEPLARELVRRKLLTPFQATVLYRGQAKGLVFGNYVVLDKLGEGGMGMVLKARHRRLDRVVALKVLPANAVRNRKDAVQRFEREMAAVARMKHPNIVQAYDADIAGTTRYLAMEYVRGLDLQQYVQRFGPLSPTKAVDLILQAAYGLEHAHAQGIIHRDIKPSNLLLEESGIVKILDLGLARIDGSLESGERLSEEGLTHTGAVMGTLDYMSPEQALDTKHADHRTDIYSLGCTLFFLLTGRTLFGGDTMMKKLLAHREQPVPSLGSVRPGAPESLDLLFRALVAKNSADRFQSMTDVVRALTAWRSESTADGGRQPVVAPVTQALGVRPDDPLRETDFSLGPPQPPELVSPALGSPARVGAAPGSAAPVSTNPSATVGAGRRGPGSGWTVTRDARSDERFDRGDVFAGMEGEAGDPTMVNRARRMISTRMLLIGAVTVAVALIVAAAVWRGIHPREPGRPLAANGAGLNGGGPTGIGLRNGAAPGVGPPARDAEVWTPLFNGRDLTGWLADSSGAMGKWRVENGVLKGKGRDSYLFTARHDFTDFHLRAEVRINNVGNSGLFFRAAPNDGLPIGYEAQIGHPNYGDLHALGMSHEGGPPGQAQSRPVIAPGAWCKVEVIAEGPRMQIRLDDQMVVDVTDDRPVARRVGHIALQSFTDETEVEFRSVEMRLPPPADGAQAIPGAPPVAVAPFTPFEARRAQREWADFLKRDATLTNSVGMSFALIPPGRYRRGSPADEPGHLAQEEPAHDVTLTRPFLLGLHEVTQEQFTRVTGENPSTFKDGDEAPRRPAERVRWTAAVDFCQKLTDLPEEKAAGRKYRLPTEAEWEYACRAGSGAAFAFGATLDDKQARIGPPKQGDSPAVVGAFPANAFGLFDMHGNVWEWCRDPYDPRYYRQREAVDPQGPAQAADNQRPLRGGTWNRGPNEARSAYRNAAAENWEGSDIGFRVLLEVTP